MRSEKYGKRKKLSREEIDSSGRYVMGAIRSHRRPVVFPMSVRPVDDPERRGLTRDDD